VEVVEMEMVASVVLTEVGWVPADHVALHGGPAGDLVALLAGVGGQSWMPLL